MRTALAHASPGCAVCGTTLAVPATGRPRKYCSRRCNQKAVRNRRILIDVLTELEAVRIAFDIEDATEEDHRVA